MNKHAHVCTISFQTGNKEGNGVSLKGLASVMEHHFKQQEQKETE